MVTEKGTVKVSTPVTAQVQNELNKPTLVLGVLETVFGGVCFFADIVYIIARRQGASYYLTVLAIIFLVCGVVTLVNRNQLNKSFTKYSVVDEVEFFRGYFILREFTDGEHTSTIKVYYCRLVKVKETSTFLFMYNTRVTAVVVDKRNLPLNELNAVRKLLGRPAVGNSVFIPEQPQYTQYSQNTQSTFKQPEEPPAEPFTEFHTDGDGNGGLNKDI